MAGYMGFGMQSWVYKRRPRKSFSKRGRVPSFSPLPKYSRTFTLKPKVKENSKALTLLLMFSLITLFVLMFIWKQDFQEYSRKQRAIVENSINKMDEKAFVFLINSGKDRLKSNRPIDAYYEFNLAFNINSGDEELNKLLTETLLILSARDDKYSNELDKLLLLID